MTGNPPFDPAALPPANWYADPVVPSQWRYWDGRQWTEHVAPMGQAPASSTQGPEVTRQPAVVSNPSAVQGSTVARYAELFVSRVRWAKVRKSPPTVSDLVTGMNAEAPRHPLEEQVEVAGETYYIKGIRRVFADHSMPITQRGTTLEELVCLLVPEPWNPHDPNAVAVTVGIHQVGHLPAELAVDYAPGLSKLARAGSLATGQARVWAQDNAGVLRARVTILIPEAQVFRRG